MRYIFFMWILVNGIVFQATLFAMNSSDKTVTVYSHGFGEELCQGEGQPRYPNTLGETGFYTQPAVHILAKFIKNKVDQGYQSIFLEGRSCGAGTALNMLYHLQYYDRYPGYFEDTTVKNKQDADKILQAINNGGLILTVPLLSLKKTMAVNVASYFFTFVTIAAATVLSGKVFNKWVGIFTGFMGSFLAFTIKSVHEVLTVGVSVPISSEFDASHIAPIDAAQQLKGKLTCPILIHCCKQDGVVASPDEDTVKLYESLKHNETYILLSDDADHNHFSEQYGEVKRAFLSKYKYKDYLGDYTEFNETQPTIAELRKIINTSKSGFC